MDLGLHSRNSEFHVFTLIRRAEVNVSNDLGEGFIVTTINIYSSDEWESTKLRVTGSIL